MLRLARWVSDPLPIDSAGLLDKARALHHAGRVAEAELLCRRILQLEPDQAEALYRLARIAQLNGRLPVAAALLQRALARTPDNRRFHKVLGDVLLAQSKPSQAAQHFRAALLIDPGAAETRHNLGLALFQMGQSDEAVRCVREALALEPRSDLHSNLLLMLQYVPGVQRTTVAAEARSWAAKYVSTVNHRHANEPEPERRLRIGYVSGDFRQHPVAYFLGPVLRAHDRTRVEVFCYTNNRVVDATTERLRSTSDHWRPIFGLTDTQAAELVQADAIDILVDLAGHTAGNRLTLFAQRPAPVQAAWAGYSDTTGLSAIDYFIGDRWVYPEATDEQRYFVERIVSLPNYFLCYEPPLNAPEVAPPPVLTRGYITFGCFNTLAKVNATVVSVWSEILKLVPDARLYLKTDALADRGVRDHFARQFEDHGIPPDRLIFERRSSSWSDYASAYAQMDIALDPFPYNGGTISMDGLWMGVPMVSLTESRGVGRMGKGILSCIGLDAYAKSSVHEYITTALSLARDRERLAKLRTDMRRRMSESPLCATRDFTGDLESLYRGMWARWCNSAEGG